VADEGQRLGQKWGEQVDIGMALGCAFPHHGADDQMVAVGNYGRQLADPSQINQMRRSGQPERQQRDEALPSCKGPRILTVLQQQCQCFIQCRRRTVLKRRRFHSCRNYAAISISAIRRDL
jgi:hypothetical protein